MELLKLNFWVACQPTNKFNKVVAILRKEHHSTLFPLLLKADFFMFLCGLTMATF